MPSLGDLFVVVGAKIDGFRQAMSDVSGTLDSTATKATASATIVQRAFAGIGFAAIGAGMLAAANKFDEASVIIQNVTGATGEKLKGFEDSFRSVYKTVDQSSRDVSTTLALLATRTDLTGTALEGLTRKTLDLAKTHREDVTVLVPLVTRMFGDWSISAQNAGKSMDFLKVTSQQTGSKIADITQLLVYAGAPLRSLGYDFEKATVLIAKFIKEGVNTELVLGAMKAILGKFAKEGITDTAAAWKDFILQVQAGKVTFSDIAQTAGEFGVGRRAANDLFRAIIEGRFAIDDTTKSFQQMATKVTENAETLGGKFTVLTHQVETLASTHKDLIVILGMTYPAWSRMGNVAAPAVVAISTAMGGLIARFVGPGGATEGLALISSSTVALGGTFTTTGATIALAGKTAALGWAGLLGPLVAAAAIVAGMSWGLQKIFGPGGIRAPGTPGSAAGGGAMPAPLSSISDLSRMDFSKIRGGTTAATTPPPGPKRLTDDQYQAMAAEIDRYTAHNKALLELDRMRYVQEETLGQIAAKDNIARLEALNQADLALTLAGIDKKQALLKQTGEAKPGEVKKDSTLVSQRQQAIDDAAKKTLENTQKYALEENAIRITDIKSEEAHQKGILDAEAAGYNAQEKERSISAETNLSLQLSLNRQELDNAIKAIDDQEAIVGGKKTAVLEAQRKAAIDSADKTEQQLRAIYDVNLAKFWKDVEGHVRELNQKLADDQLHAQRMEESGQMEHQTRMLDLQRQQADFELSIGKITESERLAIYRRIDDEEEKLQEKAIRREIDLLNARTDVNVNYAAQRMALENQLTGLEDRRAARELADTHAASKGIDEQNAQLRRQIQYEQEVGDGIVSVAERNLRLLESEIQLRELRGISNDEQIIALELMRIKTDALRDSTRLLGDLAVSLHRDYSNLFQSFSAGVADSILVGGKFWKFWRQVWFDFEKAVITDVVKTALKALADAIINNINLGTTLGGVLGKIGIGGKVSNPIGSGPAIAGAGTPGIPSGGGAASGAGGLLGAGVSSVVGMVTGAISAVTGVIGVFQNMHQETTLNAIEESTRYLMIGLVKQSDSLLNDSHVIRNTLTDFMSWNWNVATTYFQGISVKLDTIISKGGFGQSATAAMQSKAMSAESVPAQADAFNPSTAALDAVAASLTSNVTSIQTGAHATLSIFDRLVQSFIDNGIKPAVARVDAALSLSHGFMGGFANMMNANLDHIAAAAGGGGGFVVNFNAPITGVTSDTVDTLATEMVRRIRQSDVRRKF